MRAVAGSLGQNDRRLISNRTDLVRVQRGGDSAFERRRVNQLQRLRIFGGGLIGLVRLTLRRSQPLSFHLLNQLVNRIIK